MVGADLRSGARRLAKRCEGADLLMTVRYGWDLRARGAYRLGQVAERV